MIAELQRQEAAQGRVTEATKAQSTALFQANEETKKAIDLQKQHVDAVRAATDPFFAFEQATRQRTDAQTKLNEAVAAHGPKSREANEASIALLQSTRDLDLAALNLAPHMGAVNQMLDDMVKRGVVTADQAVIIRGELDRVQGSAAKLVDGSPYGVDVTANTAPAQQSMHHVNSIMVAYLNSRPTTEIRADTRPASEAVKAWLRSIPPKVMVRVRADTQNIMVPGRQHGGPVRRRKPYLVGEHGPEWFVPQLSGFVVTARQAAAAVARLNGGMRTAAAVPRGGAADTVIHAPMHFTLHGGATRDDAERIRQVVHREFGQLAREVRRRV